MLRNRRSGGVWLGLLVGALLLTLPDVLHPAHPAAATGVVPAFDHIFIVVMENHAYNEIIGNTTAAPYTNSLANRYGLATNYVAVTHPSLPNYLALIGGSTFGITSDCTSCRVNAPNLVADRVEQSGRTWKGYMESMPGTSSACSMVDAYPYVQKHDPFVYFDDIRNVAGECDKVVPYTALAADLASAATTPNYVWITPNMCNDTHDCSINTGDTWLQNNVPAILN